MIPKYSDKTNKITVELEEQDYYEANEIEQMINGSVHCKHCNKFSPNRAWELIQKHWNGWRELLIQVGKQGTTSRAKRELSDLKFAKLDGFDTATTLPSRS